MYIYLDLSTLNLKILTLLPLSQSNQDKIRHTTVQFRKNLTKNIFENFKYNEHWKSIWQIVKTKLKENNNLVKYYLLF